MSYTKGPWKYRETPKDTSYYYPAIYWVDTKDNIPVADIKDNGNPRENANLISAAPDLLEVLKDVWKCGDSIRHNSVIWEDIKRVIDKAEGREGK